jgi:hypothetical protein
MSTQHDSANDDLLKTDGGAGSEDVDKVRLVRARFANKARVALACLNCGAVAREHTNGKCLFDHTYLDLGNVEMRYARAGTYGLWLVGESPFYEFEDDMFSWSEFDRELAEKDYRALYKSDGTWML